MVSDSQTFKPISAADSHRLADLEEARGHLLAVSELEGYVVAVFSWGAISIHEEYAAKLRDLVGKKIGILSLNGIHIRDLENHA
jgi:hypothetical protein